MRLTVAKIIYHGFSKVSHVFFPPYLLTPLTDFIQTFTNVIRIESSITTRNLLVKPQVGFLRSPNCLLVDKTILTNYTQGLMKSRGVYSDSNKILKYFHLKRYWSDQRSWGASKRIGKFFNIAIGVHRVKARVKSIDGLSKYHEQKTRQDIWKGLKSCLNHFFDLLMIFTFKYSQSISSRLIIFIGCCIKGSLTEFEGYKRQDDDRIRDTVPMSCLREQVRYGS